MVGVVGHVVDERPAQEATGGLLVVRPEVDAAVRLRVAVGRRQPEVLHRDPVGQQRDEPVLLRVRRTPVEVQAVRAAAGQRTQVRNRRRDVGVRARIAVHLVERHVAVVADRHDAELVRIAIADRDVVELGLVVRAAVVVVLEAGVAPRRAEADHEQRQRSPVDVEPDHVLVEVVHVVGREVVRYVRRCLVDTVVRDRVVELGALLLVLVAKPPAPVRPLRVAILDPRAVQRRLVGRLQLAVDLDVVVLRQDLLARVDPVVEVEAVRVLRVLEVVRRLERRDAEARGGIREAVGRARRDGVGTRARRAAQATPVIGDRRRAVLLVVILVVNARVESLERRFAAHDTLAVVVLMSPSNVDELGAVTRYPRPSAATGCPSASSRCPRRRCCW